MELADRAVNRDNNIDLLRLILAILVLYGHSFSLTRPGLIEPIGNLMGILSIHLISVNAFFVISGFLITASINRSNIFFYSISRLLRIYPALIVSIIVTIIFFGLFITELRFSEFLEHPQTAKFLRNTILYDTVVGLLPSTLQGRPYEVINGSLWTLVVELRCYFIVGILGVLGILRDRLFGSITILALIFLMFSDIGPNIPLIHEKNNWLRVTAHFFAGALFWLNRDIIKLKKGFFTFSLLFYFLIKGTPNFLLLSLIPFTYMVLFLGYYKTVFNPTKYIGDISYGMYIYAFPVQQALGYYFPNINVYVHAIFSLLITSVLSKLSWDLIEKKAINMKNVIKNIFKEKYSILK
jgi:peptidoglycan/LPS O-acetylase OafA/YrhL